MHTAAPTLSALTRLSTVSHRTRTPEAIAESSTRVKSAGIFRSPKILLSLPFKEDQGSSREAYMMKREGDILHLEQAK